VMNPFSLGRGAQRRAADLFNELRAQGFTRLRVNGKVHEIDALPKLEKNKKHTIEIVVDRLKVNVKPSSGWPSRSDRAAPCRWRALAVRDG